MKIAIIGPAHPYKGGIPQHTTELAHRLEAAGHEVTIVSWKSQYPFFYPGQQFVPDNKPELPLFGSTKRVLSWKQPVGWWLTARKLRRYDEVIFVWWVPTIQGPVYLNMLKALGRRGPRTVLIAHNVTQHTKLPMQPTIVRAVFNQVDKVIVHSDSQAELAKTLTRTPVVVATMAAHLPGQPAQRKPHATLHRSLLFFGLIRRYKGVDILIKALAEVPDVALTIAGELWGKQQAELEQLIQDLNLSKRVALHAGYVPADDISKLFADADALVLPYRSGTGTQNVDLAFTYGVPVIATKVGTMAKRIRHDVDGLLCSPNDVGDLAKAIRFFYEPGVAKRLQNNLPQHNVAAEWQAYVAVLTQA